MTWAKLSDDFGDDCWTLSDAAFRLHVEALCWSGRKLLDLRVAKDDVSRFAKHPTAADELLDCGWWTDDGDYFLIRHHAAYQRSRVDVLAQQEANRSNGAKGGRPAKVSRQQERPEPETQSLTDSVTDPAETQSLTDSLSESKSERDRTGRVAFTERDHSVSGTADRDDTDDEPEDVPPVVELRRRSW